LVENNYASPEAATIPLTPEVPPTPSTTPEPTPEVPTPATPAAEVTPETPAQPAPETPQVPEPTPEVNPEPTPAPAKISKEAALEALGLTPDAEKFLDAIKANDLPNYLKVATVDYDKYE